MPSPLLRRLLFLALSLAVVLPVVGAAVMARDRDGAEESDSLYKYLAVFTEVLGLVRNAYVEPTEPDLLLAGALDGAVGALGPFALYLPAEAVAGHETALAAGPTRSGIRLARDGGVVFAARVEKGSPGSVAGVLPGDILARIGGRSTRDLPAWEVESLLAAEPGSAVETEWIRRGEPRAATLALAAYPAPGPELHEERGVAVLRLPRLEEGTIVPLRQVLADLGRRGGKRLLFDLRGADGPDPRVAWAIAGLFADGELGRLEVRGRVIERGTDRQPDLFSGEMVILVDRSTLGPAELLAEILRQRAGARLVGEETFGFTGRLETVPLAGGARLRLPTAFFRGPDGKALDGGIVPDLEVTERSRRFGEKDLPLSELIERKGLDLLLGIEHLPAKKAA